MPYLCCIYHYLYVYVFLLIDVLHIAKITFTLPQVSSISVHEYVHICVWKFVHSCLTLVVYIQGVPGGKDLTSGECSLGQTIPI